MKEAMGGRAASGASAQRAGRLADAFGRAGKSVVRAFDDRLGEHGVSTPRSKLLAEVARMQPVRLADLAREVGISQGTASTLVEALVRDGLVARGVDDNDRRAIRLTTTPEGETQARNWLRDYVVVAGEIFSCLTAEEQRQLTRLLDRIAESLDSPAQPSGGSSAQATSARQLSRESNHPECRHFEYCTFASRLGSLRWMRKKRVSDADRAASFPPLFVIVTVGLPCPPVRHAARGSVGGRMYVRAMSGSDVQAAVRALRAAFDDMAACDVDLLTRPDLVAALDELETLGCRLPSVSHRLLARLQAEATPQQMGAKSWKEVLAVRWRISTSEAHRRLTEAAVLAPRQAVTGEALAPALPATAAAQAHGLINAEHVEVIRKAMAKVPGFVDTSTRERIEVDLVRTAVGNGPKELKDSADRTLFLLDQDGPEPDERERARKRAVTKHKQREDGMVDVSATLTPEAWAVWEAIFAKFAAPGMCNPDDPQPCTSGTPSQAQIDHDHRSLAQRQHDALLAGGRIALMSGQLGQLNGLPVSVIIRTTLQDLESRAGVGVTGGGTVMPIAEVIRMAGHANHYLAVFDRATGSALDLFRTKRVASAAQRIMLIARDGGCTKPGCTVGAYGCQGHHVEADFAKGGNTNVDELGLACGPDNRSVDNNGGWTTQMNERCEVEWTPPPPLDTGQARINNYHRPERLLRPPEQPEPHSDNDTAASAKPAEGNEIGDAQPGAPQPADNPGEPGGPAPPDDRAA